MLVDTSLNSWMSFCAARRMMEGLRGASRYQVKDLLDLVAFKE